jgi:trigger factor
MHIEEIKNEDLEIHLKVQINSKDVEAKYSSEISSIVKKVKLNGFRAGKTPPSVVESMYGKSIYEEISHKLIEENVEKILKDRDITPSIQPKLEDLKNTKGENIEFTLKIEYLPKITIPDLKSIKLEKPSAKISEADLEKELNLLADNNPLYTTKDDKAEKGDQVRIDFTGRINGEEFKGGKSQDFLLVLGTNSMIPGFEDQILQHKAGEEFTINVKFPDE